MLGKIRLYGQSKATWSLQIEQVYKALVKESLSYFWNIQNIYKNGFTDNSCLEVQNATKFKWGIIYAISEHFWLLW